jgi:NAD(P)H-dependent FMN reductase
VGERVVVAVSGSLQRESSNSALLHAIVAIAASATVFAVQVWDELGALPPFRPDLDGDEHVDSLRRAVDAADAVLIATPEYAGGMPGTLKNALDWLVGSGELYGKPVVVVSAAPSAERGHNARRWVEEVVAMQGARVADSFTVAVARSDGGDPLATTAEAVWQRVVDALRRDTG